MRAGHIFFALALAGCTATDVAPPALGAVELTRDPAVSRVAADASSGAYTLDARHSSVIWRVRHWGLGPYTGRFDAMSGALQFDAANPATSSVSVRILLPSISTGLLTPEGERGFDREIAGYLGAEAQSDIVFTSRSIEITGPHTGRITGDLSLNGRTHPVTLDTVFEGGRVNPYSNRPTLGFTGRTILRRSQWVDGQLHNIQAPGDEVEIIISVEFSRPG